MNRSNIGSTDNSDHWIDNAGIVRPLPYSGDTAEMDNEETGYDPIILAGEIYVTWLQTQEPTYQTEETLQEVAKKAIMAATIFHEEVIKLMEEGE